VDRTVTDGWYATAAQGTLAASAVQSVVGTAPLSSSGTTTRTISIAPASAVAPGSMSAADFTKLAAITGTNTGDNAPNSLYSGLVSNATHTGDATGSTALTLATVNSNVGAFGSATQTATFTVNAKGLTTAAANVTITPAWANITSKTTTRAGYGITDAAANGAVTGTGITMSTARLLGRSTAATGAIEEITLGTNLSFTGTTLNATGGAGTVTGVSGTAPIVSSGGAAPAISITPASGSAPGSMSSADFSKLAGIAAGATANATDAQLRDRATHTGTQAIDTISGLGSGVATALAVNSGSAGALGVVIARGTVALGTTAIASGANATLIVVAAAGVAATDVIDWGFSTNPNAVTGYNAASASGCLVISCYPTAGNVNFVVSNPTAGSITPGALTLNWTVMR
jgi:hypothetical protein